MSESSGDIQEAVAWVVEEQLSDPPATWRRRYVFLSKPDADHIVSERVRWAGQGLNPSAPMRARALGYIDNEPGSTVAP